MNFESKSGQHISEIKILDNLGRVIYKEDFESNLTDKIEIQLDRIENGLYIYNVKSTSKTFTGKIIKTN